MSASKKLSEKFVFWYHINEISADQEYESQIKKLAEFDTLEDFWAIFQYLKKPDDCKQAIEFQLFKNNIKPMWEDENNKNGGRIALKLRKEFSNLVWEELVFAFIGGYFDKDIKDEINGLVINCKKDFNTLQIWIKSYSTEVTSAIEKNIRDILSIPNEVALDIKPFNQPQKDYNNYNNNYNHNYNHNYNNYKGYNKNKKQNNNYYKKKESKDVKEQKNSTEGNKINEPDNKEEDVKETKNDEEETKKEKPKIKKKEKTNEEKETPKEETIEKKQSNDEFTEVKKKKKKKKE